MILPQPVDSLLRSGAVTLLHPREDPFERIGRLAHRRNDDEQMLLLADDFVQIAYAIGIPHRSSAEFIDFHAC